MSTSKSFSFKLYGLLHSLLLIPAAMVSWYFNNSIFWVIIHIIISPWYMLYSLLARRFYDGAYLDILCYYF